MNSSNYKCVVCETYCLDLLQNGEQFNIRYTLCHQVDPICTTKVSSNPKDTFPDTQHICFLFMHFITLVIYFKFYLVSKCGVLLEFLSVLKQNKNEVPHRF